MRQRVAALVLAACFACPGLGLAQSPTPAPALVPHSERAPDLLAVPKTPLFEAPAPQADDNGFWAPFKAVPDDFVRFLSADTAKVVGFGSVAAIAASPLDHRELVESSPGAFKAGNIGGSFLAQAGLSFGTYAIGRWSGSNKMTAVGSDLLRAHILAQGIVQAGKMMTHRERPDGSNNHSLPSGHTASAFVTATVLQRHFGWKVGVPAYAFGAYVAASRMSADKHHLSDVLLGAAIGMAAGRTVTLGVGGAQFDMGVAPTIGGAAITFTKR